MVWETFLCRERGTSQLFLLDRLLEPSRPCYLSSYQSNLAASQQIRQSLTWRTQHKLGHESRKLVKHGVTIHTTTSYSLHGVSTLY